jgi:hypothetical protein
MYFAIFCIYWIWNLVSFVTSVRETREIALFFNTQLGFNDVITSHHPLPVYLSITPFRRSFMLLIH